jgi:hypothetical protein
MPNSTHPEVLPVPSGICAGEGGAGGGGTTTAIKQDSLYNSKFLRTGFVSTGVVDHFRKCAVWNSCRVVAGAVAPRRPSNKFQRTTTNY